MIQPSKALLMTDVLNEAVFRTPSGLLDKAPKEPSTVLGALNALIGTLEIMLKDGVTIKEVNFDVVLDPPTGSSAVLGEEPLRQA